MNIDKASKNFMVQSILLCCVLTICGFVAMEAWSLDLLCAIIVSACFVLVIDIASALIFRWVAAKHSDMLPTFITGVSGFRFLAALVVMAVWYVISDRDSMLQFIVVFLLYYMVSLIHHSIIFSRISKRL
jgi:O-antigen/teichoic acid export membrane protein